MCGFPHWNNSHKNVDCLAVFLTISVKLKGEREVCWHIVQSTWLGKGGRILMKVAYKEAPPQDSDLILQDYTNLYWKGIPFMYLKQKLHHFQKQWDTADVSHPKALNFLPKFCKQYEYLDLTCCYLFHFKVFKISKGRSLKCCTVIIIYIRHLYKTISVAKIIKNYLILNILY